MEHRERHRERHTRPSRSPNLLDHPVYLSLLAGAGLSLALVATMFSWIAAALGLLVFLLAAGRWTWTMREDFVAIIADADRPEDADTRRER